MKSTKNPLTWMSLLDACKSNQALARPMLGIDTGKLGGFAWQGGNIVATARMPETPEQIFGLLKAVKIEYPNIFCFLENVGFYRPGNSAPAAVTFGKHVGHLQMALIALDIKTIKVSPVSWMKYILSDIKYPDKTIRKNKIKSLMQEQYPDLKITLKTSDALGILTYAKQADF